MGILSDAILELRSYWLGPFGSGDRAVRQILTDGTPTPSGVVVNEHTAQGIPAFWCAINLLSTTTAGLPLHLYRRVGSDGRERVHDDLAALVSLDASSEMTAFAFRRSLILNAALTGNSFAEIVRNRDSRRPAALHLIPSSSVDVIRDERTSQIRYRVAGDGETVELRPDQILHLAGPSHDGLVGVSVIGQHRHALGLAIAAESYGSAFFTTAGTPSGLLEHPGRLSDPVKRALREGWEGLHRPGSRRLAILEEGMKYHSISIPPEDMQFLSTRNFQVVEIARIFNMPPSLLGAAVEGASLTYKNSEDERQAFVDFCLTPWTLALEQELARKLLPPEARRTMFFRHRFEGLLRADTASRYQA